MGAEQAAVVARGALVHHRSLGVVVVVANIQAQRVVQAAPKAKKARRRRLVSTERKNSLHILRDARAPPGRFASPARADKMHLLFCQRSGHWCPPFYLRACSLPFFKGLQA